MENEQIVLRGRDELSWSLFIRNPLDLPSEACI